MRRRLPDDVQPVAAGDGQLGCSGNAPVAQVTGSDQERSAADWDAGMAAAVD
jgi:hypothetical protein